MEFRNVDISLMIFRLIVLIFGLAGNILVIFVVIVLKEYKKAVTHLYVLQLAIADALFLLTLPFNAVEDIHNEWIFSSGMCKAKETILFVNYYSSIFFLTIMSIDRYIAVCRGFSSVLQKLRKKLVACWIVAGVWIISFLLCAPIMLYSDKMGYDPTCKCAYDFPTPIERCVVENFSTDKEYQICLNSTKCKTMNEISAFLGYEMSANDITEEYTTSYLETTAYSFEPEEDIYEHGCSYLASGLGWKIFVWCNFIVMFAIPFVIMLVCYTSIALRLQTWGGRGASRSGPGRNRNRRRSLASIRADKNQNRVTILCGLLVILFLICWLPFHSIHLKKMTGIKGPTEYCARLSAVASLIAYLNSAFNPYMYNFIGTRFRNRLRSAAHSISKSIKERATSASSSGVAVRYRASKRTDGGPSTSNTGIATIKSMGMNELKNLAQASSDDSVFEDESKGVKEQKPPKLAFTATEENQDNLSQT